MNKVLLLVALISVIASLLFLSWAVAQHGEAKTKAGSTYGIVLPPPW